MRVTVRVVLGRPLVLNRAIDLLPADCLLIIGCEGEASMTDPRTTRDLASDYQAAVRRHAPGQTSIAMWERYLDAALAEHAARVGRAA